MTELNISNSSKKKKNTEKEERLPNLFYETSITLIPKQGKDRTRKKLQADIPDEYRFKILKKILAYQLSSTLFFLGISCILFNSYVYSIIVVSILQMTTTMLVTEF